MDPDTRAKRHHALFAILVAGACTGAAATFANNWLQGPWLAGKWLYREPRGLIWMGSAAAVATAALASLLVTWRRGRWSSTSYAPLRWIAVGALAVWMYGWTVEPPVLVYDAELAVAAAAAVWCAGVALVARTSDRPWPRWARALDGFLLLVAICAFTAEAALRFVRSRGQMPLLATSGTDVDAWIRAQRLPPGTFHLGFRVDAEGFVDGDGADAAKREHLVACIGDSFSVGVVPHHLHYTTIAEGAFEDLEVHNIGVPGAGPREYLRLLETDALPLRPDLIVIALFIGNDITDTRPRRSKLQAWMHVREVLVLQFPRRLWALARERRAGAGEGNAFDSFGVSPSLSLSPLEAERHMPWLADPLKEPAGLSEERFAYNQATRVEIARHSHRGEYVRTFDYLERIVARARPIPVAFLLIPDEYQIEDAQWEELLARGAALGADRDLPQRLLGAWLEERGIPHVDLLAPLRNVEPLADGARHVYHLRDTHWNARGNRIAGDELADLIERCGIATRMRPR